MKGIAPTLGWVAVGLLLLVSFGLDIGNVTQGGGIDLRNRITGVRLLADGFDAYHYKWGRSQPEKYADPYNNPLLPVSKTTATPALLLLHEPLALLPYRLAEFLWLPFQWLLLLGTLGLWLRRCTESRQRLLLAAIVTAFTYTAAWRLHAERGQSYVLLLFVFAWWLAATLDPKTAQRFTTGLLAGLLVALRPPFLILAPFLLLHRRGQLPGAVVGLLLGIGLPLLLNSASWTNYATAMGDHSYLYRMGEDPHPPPQHFPPTIEGIPTDILGNFVLIPYADFSVHAGLRALGLEPFPELPPLLAVGALFLAWLWFSRGLPTETLLLGLAAWFFVIDLFLPAYRNTYNDVLILAVLALATAAGRLFSWAGQACLLALPIGWLIYVFAPMKNELINLPTFFFTIGAVLFLLDQVAAMRRRPAAAPARTGRSRR